MINNGSVFFGAATYYNAAAGTLTGANNGLIVAGGNTVQLGDVDATGAPLIRDSRINLGAFAFRLNRGLTDIRFRGSGNQPVIDGQFDLAQLGAGVVAQQWNADTAGDLIIRMIQRSNVGANSTARFDFISGGFDDEEGASLITHTDTHTVNPSVVFITSKGSAELRIGTQDNVYGAPITFVLTDVEKMRLDANGSLLIGRTTSFAADFSLQVGNGTGTNGRSLFHSGNVYAIGVRNAGGNAAYLGATLSATPDFVFSNNAGNEVARVRDGGGFSAPAAGYGVGGASGALQGMSFGGGGNVTTLFMSGAGGNMGFGSNGNGVKYAFFDDADNSLLINGSVGAGGSGARWSLGFQVAAVTTFDPTGYVQVAIGGVIYNLALANI